ncbi:MAG: phosphate acetyltransferase [Bacteroidetes bacterium]|nr:MAG: phosphate acetyltransferase [Bacteroidota bacterium]
MELLDQIWANARKAQKRIVLPEAEEERTLRAADKIIAAQLALPVLLGDPVVIQKQAAEWGLESIEKAEIVNPRECDKRQAYIDLLLSLRKHKGLTEEKATELVNDPLYFAALMIKNGDADGEVAGAMNATGDVLRPAFQIIKTVPGSSVVSGAFIMILKENPYVPGNLLVFADCAVNPNPTAEELAQIAVSSAQTAKAIAGIDPKVAMLSFSTKGSAKHEMVDKVVEATAMARKMAQERNMPLVIDGELQADAAIVEAVGKKKAPGSEVAGIANVLVFPSLEAGNIGYKLVQRLAGAEAIGPVLQGMAAPVNDLSRGCSVSDIVNLVAITANQAAGK